MDHLKPLMIKVIKTIVINNDIARFAAVCSERFLVAGEMTSQMGLFEAPVEQLFLAKPGPQGSVCFHLAQRQRILLGPISQTE